MAKVIGIYNQEKNTSKTITSAYLSESLATLSLNVLCLEIDSRQCLAKFLNVRKSKGKIEIKELESIISYISKIKKHQASWDFLSFEDFTFPKRIDLKVNFSEIFLRYDFVIIDFPSGETEVSNLFLTFLNSVVIPIECEFYGMDELDSTLRKLLTQENLLIEGILLTKFDSNNNKIHKFVEKLNEYFSEFIFKTIIKRNFWLGSPSFFEENQGQTLTHVGFSDYLKLANEIIEKTSNGQE